MVGRASVLAVVSLLVANHSGRAETSGATLDLEALVEEALSANPGLEAARQQWLAAQAVPARLRSLPDPSVRYGFYNVPTDALNGFDGEFRLQYRQLFPYPGTLALRGAVAEKEAVRKGFTVAVARVQLAAAVRRAYYELYFANRAREIHHQHLSLVRELSSATEALYATAQVPQENVLRSLVELTDLFQQLAEVDSRIGTAAAALNRLLHRPSNIPLGKPQPPRMRLTGVTLQGLMSLAEAKHPGLAMASAAVARDRTAVKLERHEATPDFGVTAEWWTGSDGMGGQKQRYAILITTTLPWIHGGKYDAAVEEALAAKRADEAQKIDLLDHIREEVSAAWIRLRAQARIVELYRTSLIPQTEQSLRAARSAYQTGTTSFVTVVDNERTLLLNRLALARAEADYGRALADLGAAAGVIELGELEAPADPETGAHR
ncbi:MAG: TolC family protein [Acidobacteriota bacterium]